MKRTICSYGVGGLFLALTTQHTQHTFGLFEQVDALSWVLAVALELAIAVAAMFTFDRELEDWARKVSGVWLSGLLIASYSLNVVFYWSKADAWGLALGMIFPASIAVLGALEPALRQADKRSKEKKTVAVNRSRQALDTSSAGAAGRQLKASGDKSRAPKISVKVTAPEPSLLPEHATPDSRVDASTPAQLDAIQPDNLTPSAANDWQTLARQLYITGGMSKADIARAVGKSRQTVSTYLNSLAVSGTEVAA